MSLDRWWRISATLLVAVLGIAGSITGSSDRLVAGIGGNASSRSLRRDRHRLPGSGASRRGEGDRCRRRRTDAADIHRKASERVVLLGVDDSIRAMLSDLQRAVQDQIGPLRHAAGQGRGRSGHGVRGGRLGVAWATARSPSRQSSAVPMPNGSTAAISSSGPLPLIQRLTDRVGMIDSVLVVACAERRSRECSRGGHRRGGRAGRRRRTDFPVRAIRWGRLRSCAP